MATMLMTGCIFILVALEGLVAIGQDWPFSIITVLGGCGIAIVLALLPTRYD